MTSKKSASIRERLHGLASFVSAFEAPGFVFGRWKQPVDEPGVMVAQHFTPGKADAEFVKACYDLGWILADFDWPEWKETPEALRLRDDSFGIENASCEQLAKLLTVLVRQDRFVEGALREAFEAGLLLRIVRRCAILENIPPR
jgi:hypothetical protein